MNCYISYAGSKRQRSTHEKRTGRLLRNPRKQKNEIRLHNRFLRSSSLQRRHRNTPWRQITGNRYTDDSQRNSAHTGTERHSDRTDKVTCAIRKDAGDDPDTTNGILVYATVEKTKEQGITLDGGIGVGRVTKAGLSQKIGEAAINPVPKSMILRAATETAEKYDYEGGLKIIISVPEGVEIGKKTFNPRLGIVGGISILGTSGIVEPMSEAALVQSIRVEMKQHFSQGEEYLLVTPGNYGADYLREHMDLPYEKNIKCSNYVGETIDMAIDMGVKGILFIAHIGKFVKVAAGIMNTHSHSADARMEVLASNAIRAGAPLECAKEILNASTTDEALDILNRYQMTQGTMKEVLDRIQFYLNHRSYEQILLGAVVFSNTCGYLGQTADAAKLIEKINIQNKRIKDK